MSGEGCAAKAHNAAKADLLHNGLVVGGNLGDEGIGGINSIGPFITFHGNLNMRDGTSGKVRAGADRFNGS